MVYSLDEIRRRIEPVARKYDISAMYVFGSYARGEATDASDVDLLFQLKGSRIRGIMIGALYEDLEESLDKRIDLVTEETLHDKQARELSPWFISKVFKERIQIL